MREIERSNQFKRDYKRELKGLRRTVFPVELPQNCFGKPACFRTAFAVWRETIFDGKAMAIDRAFPYFMVAFALANNRQPASCRIRFKSRVKSANDYAATVRVWTLNQRISTPVTGSLSRCPFNSSISGTRSRSLANSSA